MTIEKDKIRLLDILDAISEIETISNDTATERTKEMAIAYSIAVIGEAVKNISKELRDKYNHIPWREIGDTRNKLIHEYAAIDKKLLWKIAENEIPELKNQIEELLLKL